MDTVKTLIDKLGRAEVHARTGFSQQVLSRAIVANVMPSSWYVAIRALSEEAGIECPPALFRMKAISTPASAPKARRSSVVSQS